MEKTAYARIRKLLDEGSFIETGALVVRRSTDFETTVPEEAGDGVVTGYGLIAGRPVFVFSQDSTVLGGAMGEMHAMKIERLYENAVKTGVPVVGLIDSVGLRLQEVTDGLEGFGRIFRAKAAASGIVPMIDLVFGRAGGGMAIASELSDFVFIENDGTLFVNAPNTLADAPLDTKAGSAEQALLTGTAQISGTEDEIIADARKLVSFLPLNCKDEPLAESDDDLNRLTDEIGPDTPVDEIAAAVADNGEAMELSGAYAPDVYTGFIRLDGVTAGVIGSKQEKLSADGLKKIASFVSFLDAFSIPVVTFTNVNGFAATEEDEKTMAISAAKTAAVFANATVPKFNVILREASGTPYLVMNSKALGADVVYAFEGAKIRVMRPDSAAKIIGGSDLSETAESFDDKQTALQAAKRGYVDEIITGGELRKKLLAALELFYSKRIPAPERKHTSR